MIALQPYNPILLTAGNLHREQWIVRRVALETSQCMVERYHYAHGSSKQAVACFGLFHHDRTFWDADCYGVTHWIPPTRTTAAATYSGPDAVLSLSRMVIHPGAPRNAATFLLAQSIKQLDPRWECLVTYADEWQGHTGNVYKAANWQYIGKTVPEMVYVRNGRMMGRKRGDHTLTHQDMLDRGFEAVGKFAKHKFVYKR
jgi:hypothetical protein